MHTASQVAKWFLAHNRMVMIDEGGENISNLKLQKLLYYAQGSFLAVTDKPLFEDNIVAWCHGPVVESVYHEYKSNGSNGIPFDECFDFSQFTPDENELLKETVVRISGVDTRKCMKCGKCSASCPSYNEMEYHPHQFVSMVRKGQIEKLAASKSIYKCLSCFACLERCPRNVEPSKLVEAVRLAVVRQQGMSHMTANDVPAKWDANLPQQAIVAAMRKYNK